MGFKGNISGADDIVSGCLSELFLQKGDVFIGCGVKDDIGPVLFKEVMYCCCITDITQLGDKHHIGMVFF